MIPKPVDILNRFRTTIADCKALYVHCISRYDTHTHAGIEAAFLQFVKSWETFLEDSTLSFLCGEQPITITPLIEPKFIIPNVEDVRSIIYNGQAYTEWLKLNFLLNRFKTFFKVDALGENRLTNAIKYNQTVLGNILVIRNEIAHSSFATNNKIKIIYTNYDPLRTFSRAAEFLVEYSKEEPTKTHFIYYIEMIEITANQIIDQ